MSNVQVTDGLPAHLTYVSAGLVPAGGTLSITPPSTLTWNWPSLAPGVYSLTYQAKVDDYVQQGTVLNNCATVNGSGVPGQTACQPVSMAQIYLVRVDVYNSSGELVKQLWVQELSQKISAFQLQNPTITTLGGTTYVIFEGQQIASWDGMNQNGDPVSNGQYFIKVDNIDSLGSVTGVFQMVMVSRSIAKIQVDIYNSAGEIVRHLYAYDNDPNNAPMTQVSFSSAVLKTSVSGSQGGVPGSVTITTPNGASLVWDGRSDSGALVTNGVYMVDVYWTNGNGQTVISKSILVQSDNSSAITGGVSAWPNILKGGTTTTKIIVNSVTPYTLTVSLYNVAGNLIKTTQGASGTNQAVLDVRGVASGLYFVTVDLTDANGNKDGRQKTQIAILH